MSFNEAIDELGETSFIYSIWLFLNLLFDFIDSLYYLGNL